MLGKNPVFQQLSDYLHAYPIAAERLTLKKLDIAIDFLTFENHPYTGVNSVVTNGLKILKASKGDELIFTFDPNSANSETNIVAFMATYIELYYLDHKAHVEPGDFMYTKFNVMNGYNFKGIYVTKPVYFPEDFPEKNSLVNYLWMIPLYKDELSYIKTNGCVAFESLLENLDPDLTKLDRPSIV